MRPFGLSCSNMGICVHESRISAHCVGVSRTGLDLLWRLQFEFNRYNIRSTRTCSGRHHMAQ